MTDVCACQAWGGQPVRTSEEVTMTPRDHLAASLRLAARLYNAAVRPETIWWDDLTPEMQAPWLRAADMATTLFAAPAPLALDVALQTVLSEIEDTATVTDHMSIDGGPDFARGARFAVRQIRAALAPQAPAEQAEPRHAFMAGVHDGQAVYCAHCGLLRAHPAHREPAP